MKFQAILLLAASAIAAPTPEAVAEPAPADVGATTKAQRLLCSGLWTGNDLSFGDLKWAMNNRRDELQLKAGWWNEVNTACRSTDGRNIAQNGSRITYNHARSTQAKTTLKFNGAVVCSPQSDWRLKCDKA
ncbi:hypothetical protein BDP81DRAFT_396497 [Colletotrichum phormii]|uniref:Uncharacterized protein n=1 Tax=Colletotrichum phormii TaxID=359342 RepID=A0AAI9ZPQ8_9PEZI|nr:uncharacterized protein BDP81DRAFT_396497 [Colletotrichum phormii]KAK1634544.1 hypothetical protein BDP81DRAFT_396497 [Colletotrichum phormii]